MAREDWSISNFLSVSRILLLIPILYFLLNANGENRFYAAAMMLLVILTDFFDGRFARKFHQESDFGRIIDPLADKICVGAVVIVLTFLGDLPGWYLGVVLGRDILILLGGLYVAKSKKVILQSNWGGKVAVSVIALLIVVATLRVDFLKSVKILLLWSSLAFLALSFALYFKRFYDTVLAKPPLIERSP